MTHIIEKNFGKKTGNQDGRQIVGVIVWWLITPELKPVLHAAETPRQETIENETEN